MSKTLQFRRGSTSLINTFAGSDGELFVDTSKATVVVMNGVVLGGTPLATESFVTAALLRASTTATLGTVRIDGTSIVISSGTISVPTASSSQAGIFRVDGTSVVVSSGVISVTRNFTTSFAVSGTVVMSSPFTFRNRLINGNFQFWQRGVSTSTTGTYLADRWIASNISQQNRSTDSPDARFPYSLEFGNTTATYPLIAQRLEPEIAAGLVSSDLTISFWAKNTSGNAQLYVELAYPQTTSVYTSTMVQISSTPGAFLANPPTVSSWGFYSYTWTSAVMTTALAQGLEVRIVRDNTAPSTTRVTGVQLESGGAATPFELLPTQVGRAQCLRYFQKYPDTSVASVGGAYLMLNPILNGANRVPLPLLPVPMRATPVVYTYATNGISGYLTEFSSGSHQQISGVNGSAGYGVSKYTDPQGGGYVQFVSNPANPVLLIASYDAEL